ncbi:hypothetical protein JTB14_034585 [Gonioctena quinquepunctata]|nr:hypothetical protein JTB14_034585 [Gonioctena quinquepunctata]
MKELNIDKLISFSNEVNNLVATMKSLDNYGHYYSPQLLKEFVNKLPDSLKLKWGETVLLNHGRVNMEKFSLWISDIADAATYVTTPCKKYQGRKADIVLNAIRSEKYPKAGEIERTCIYCDKKSHSVNTCDKLKADDIDTRWATITSKKLCFSCFKKGHSRFKCKSRKECGVKGCKFRHNLLLHKTMNTTNIENNTEIETPTSSSVQSVCTVQQEEINVLLRVIPVNIHGPNGILRVYH